MGRPAIIILSICSALLCVEFYISFKPSTQPIETPPNIKPTNIPTTPPPQYKFCNANLPKPYHLFIDERDTTYAIGYYYYNEIEYLYEYGTLGILFNFPDCTSKPKPFYKDSCAIKELFFTKVHIPNVKQIH
jgi:hypothetical protein